MYFYLVEKIGDGTDANPFRPNYTGDYVGCGVVGNKFLVGTNVEIDAPLILDLQTFCTENNLIYQDVMKWFVGDSS